VSLVAERASLGTEILERPVEQLHRPELMSLERSLSITAHRPAFRRALGEPERAEAGTASGA
jgi:hypothetical protein